MRRATSFFASVWMASQDWGKLLISLERLMTRVKEETVFSVHREYENFPFFQHESLCVFGITVLILRKLYDGHDVKWRQIRSTILWQTIVLVVGDCFGGLLNCSMSDLKNLLGRQDH